MKLIFTLDSSESFSSKCEKVPDPEMFASIELNDENSFEPDSEIISFLEQYNNAFDFVRLPFTGHVEVSRS